MQNKNLILIGLFIVLILVSSSQILAFSKIDSLSAKLKTAKGEVRMEILLNLGYREHNNNPIRGIEFNKEALKIAYSLNDRRSEAKALSNMGVCNWSLGNFEDALINNRMARLIYQEIKDTLGIAKTSTNEGLINDSQGKPIVALEKYLISLEISKKFNDYKLQIANLVNIAIVYEQLENNDKMLEYYLEAEKIAIKNDLEIGILLNNIGSVYLEKSELEKAERYLKNALIQLKKEGDIRTIGFVFLNLGLVAEKKDNNKKAFRYYYKSLEKEEFLKNKSGIAQALISIGSLYNKEEDFNRAQDYLNKGLIISKEIGSISDMINFYLELSNSYSEGGNYKKALEYYVLYSESTNSRFNKTTSDKIAVLQAQYEINDKDQSNKLLRKENELQKRTINSQKIVAIEIGLVLLLLILLIIALLQNRKKELEAKKLLIDKNKKIKNHETEISLQNDSLAELNATKDRFFSVLAHDLKNPLGVVTNFSDLLLTDFHKFKDDEKKEIVKHINSSVKNVNELLENLLIWATASKNKTTVEKQKVFLQELIETSIKPYEYFANNKNISFVKKIPKNIEVETDKFMLQTIIGNITNNAIKFSQPLGEIIFNGNQNKNFIEISIKDFGIGMDSDSIDNLFNLARNKSIAGTMGEKGTGLGLILVKEFMEKLGGDITIESEINKGSKFTLKIPTKVI